MTVTNSTHQSSGAASNSAFSSTSRLLEHASASSDGFCVVREIARGGPVDVSGYERSNGEVRTRGITVQLERFRASLQPNVAGPSKQFNHIEVHTRHHADTTTAIETEKVNVTETAIGSTN